MVAMAFCLFIKGPDKAEECKQSKMFKLVLSALIALATSINALTIVTPQQGSSYANGATLGVVVIMDQFESGILNAQVVFQSSTGSQTVLIPVGPIPTLVTLNSDITDLTLIAAIPIINNIGQIAQPGYSNIIVGRPVPIPRPIPINPCYNPWNNPCYNPCRRERVPVCELPRESCKIPRRRECNIPRPRCRIRDVESYDLAEPQYILSGFNLYVVQSPEQIEEFEQQDAAQQYSQEQHKAEEQMIKQVEQEQQVQA